MEDYHSGPALPAHPGAFFSVPEQIWRCAASRPHATALATEHERIDFRDLIHEAEALSGCFLRPAADPGGIIAVATLDPRQMITAALAAWRLGCAYLPVNPSGAHERLRRILTEADVRMVAADPCATALIPSGPWSVCPIDTFAGSNARSDTPAQSARVWSIAPTDIAYVIYTSGSTGAPKGVAVTHGNLRYLVDWYQSVFRPTPHDRGVQFSALTFDAAVLETWPVLAAGAGLYLPERSLSLVPCELRDYLVARGITLCFATTAIAEQLIELDWSDETRLRFLLTGADTLRKFPRSGTPFALVNNYGPTECTVLATSGIVPARLSAEDMPSIGRAISGTQVYLLDGKMRRVADGERGQICVSGPGVAAGYVGQPDLTAQRFVQDPFVPGARMYLTGDLGRMLPNGEIEFCGRMDDQIKIRGFRIEPAEIVAALRTHPAVSAAEVTVIGTEASKQLAAYVVLRSEVSSDELRAHIGPVLPPYMAPDCFVRLERLPLTESGKIDKAALPLPDASNSLDRPAASVEFDDEIQQEVASIISGLLGGKQIHPHDNIFLIGGHSLLAAQILARLRSTFEIELPLRTIFESPTVSSLAQQIEKRMLDALAAMSSPSGATVTFNQE